MISTPGQSKLRIDATTRSSNDPKDGQPMAKSNTAKKDKNELVTSMAIGRNTDKSDAKAIAHVKREVSTTGKPKAKSDPSNSTPASPDSKPKRDKSQKKAKKSKTDTKCSKSNRPRLHPTVLTELSTKIFNPALFPRQPPRPPPMIPPRGLCYSRLPPPCAEVDDGPKWRRRRWRVWDEVYTPLRLVVLNEHLRGQLRRHQTFAMAPSTSDNVNHPVKGIHRRIFPRGREVGLTMETYDDRPHLSELHRWRQARPRAWSGHTTTPLPSPDAAPTATPVGQQQGSGVQPPLTPLNSPSTPRAPPSLPQSPPAPATTSRSTLPQTPAHIHLTPTPLLYRQPITPLKLNSEQRKAKREQMRVHKWILDIENERRWRTGMRRLMDEVYHFQEGCMLDPDKWETNKGVFLPDFDYEEVQAFADKFKSIRQHPEKIYDLYPDLGPVPGRAEAQRLIEQDEEDRRKRKEAKKARREGSESGSASPSPPEAVPKAVKPVDGQATSPVDTMGAAAGGNGDTAWKQQGAGVEAASSIAAAFATKPAEAASLDLRAAASHPLAASAKNSAANASREPAKAQTAKPARLSSKGAGRSKRPDDMVSSKDEPSARLVFPVAEAARPSKSRRSSAKHTQRPVTPAPESSSADSTDASPTTSPRLTASPPPIPSRRLSSDISAPHPSPPPPNPLETLLSVLHTVEAQHATLPGPATAARKLRADIERSDAIRNGFMAEFGSPDAGGQKAEMLRLARIMGALEQMDVEIMRQGRSTGGGKFDLREGRGGSAITPEYGPGSNAEEASDHLDVRVAEADEGDASSVDDSSESETDSVISGSADGGEDGVSTILGKRRGASSAIPTHRWGSVNMDDDTHAPSTAPESPSDSSTPPRVGPIQRKMMA